MISKTEIENGLSRRTLLKHSAIGLTVGTMGMAGIQQAQAGETGASSANVRKGRIRQSVCKWCFGNIPLESFAQTCAGMGIRSIELLEPSDWPILKKYGLICAMTPSHRIEKGLNRTENHAECLTKIRRGIDASSEAGFPNVICFSGNRAGMDDGEGLKNCVKAIKEVVGYAEQKKVTICMELLNSKRNHKDYMCDRTAWGGELVRSIGSDRFRLLYDIYHMQVQEGDVIDTIREYADCIGHYHTAGVPGRNEIDEAQELNYPAIMKAIVDTGFQGYVAQEFVPRRTPLESLRQAVEICDV
jgi:hydroxypyruvate isomerase